MLSLTIVRTVILSPVTTQGIIVSTSITITIRGTVISTITSTIVIIVHCQCITGSCFIRNISKGDYIHSHFFKKIKKKMKIYKKYELKSTFGLVTSGSVSVSKNSCLCFSNEFVLNWDLKTGELLTSNKMDSLVTFVKNKKRLAIGMVDGCVVVLNHLDSNINHAIESSIDNEIKLNGHSKFITWLEFDIEGNRLLSCSGDTDLVLWDLVLEQG